MTQPALTFTGINKSFSGGTRALRNISISLCPGERILLVGDNGSGKSTLLRIAAGLVLPTKGQREFYRSGEPRNPEIRYFGAKTGLYESLSVRENLNFYCTVLNSSCSPMSDGLLSLLEQWRLREVADRKVGELSEGTKARVALALLFMGSADLLLLDEPDNKLDLHSLAALQVALANIPRNCTTIVTSHKFDLYSSWADRVIHLDQGRIKLDTGSKLAERQISDSSIARALESYTNHSAS